MKWRLFCFISIALFSYFILTAHADKRWNNFGVSRFTADNEKDNCKQCHRSVLIEMRRFAFQHSALAYRGCSNCHVAGGGSNVRKYPPKIAKRNRISLNKYASDHLAVISDVTADHTYKVKIHLKDMSGNKYEHGAITFIPASLFDYLSDDGAPPSISDVEIQRIDILVFVSAEIAWETNEFSESKIEYGLTTSYGSSIYSDLLNKKHHLTLTGLKHKKIYHYRIVSKDLFGRESVSAGYTFDTSKAFDGKPENEKVKESQPPLSLETPPPGAHGNYGLSIRDIKIVKLKTKRDTSAAQRSRDSERSDKVAIIFYTSKRAKSIIEYSSVGPMGQTDEGLSEAERHGENGLLSKKVAGIDVCIDCHPQGASHPVGVTSRGNIIIPRDLPTAEGGIMTCVTCHLPHGSDLRFLARMDFEHDICVKCHINER